MFLSLISTSGGPAHAQPCTPTLLGNYDTPGEAFSVYVSGTTAYVADGLSGLQIIDVSNPASPSLLGNYTTGFGGVYVSGTTAYVADNVLGLQVIDVSNPASPSLLGNYNTPGAAWGVYVSGTTAYVADATSGLQIIKVMDVCGSTPPSTTTTTTTTSSTTTTLPIKKICRTCPSALRVSQGRKVCKEFTVWNCGKGTLNWTVSEDCDWLKLEPLSGTSAGERDTVTACVDTTGLDKGYYSCMVTITGVGASNSPRTCVIKLKVK